MNKPRPIALAVRLAIYGTTPALIATAVGIAYGRVAEQVAQCHRGQEVAVCTGHTFTDERDLHRHAIELPEQGEALPPGTQSAQAAASMPPIRWAYLPDSGFAMGTPLPLLASAR